ncbi:MULTISPECIES: PRC-barrel domain-containing protein [unclassified Beijerinckia]|uniref:PRC-barrel domain-containing protein n=1 Tax=unclassified Beijerinckia TaxID=2638183 RepID=UPI000898FD8F|nr:MULTISPECIES: PRC-barrel domain-containing protein [unclassified Beijerinckia]MDH7797252.1 sporulation protein YlmC with PRC-barrel domain [Beijerinckia sp. GAS462]SEC78111.1 PRC-barrel domain-containing protein [Beijerinckia sp. 28-YEA-48]
MPTSTGHTRAIAASRVTGTNVYNAQSDKIGQVQDIVLDKQSDKILFAVLSFGGFLGIGEKYHAMPWSKLNFDPDKGGYVTNLTKEQLEKAPSYDINDLVKNDGTGSTPALDYYSQFGPH